MRYPIKTSAKKFCDTIATRIARYEKYRCWASKMGFCQWADMGPKVGLMRDTSGFSRRLKMGFCQWAEVGPKVGHKWVLRLKMGFCQWAEVGPKVGLKWDTSGF